MPKSIVLSKKQTIKFIFSFKAIFFLTYTFSLFFTPKSLFREYVLKMWLFLYLTTSYLYVICYRDVNIKYFLLYVWYKDVYVHILCIKQEARSTGGNTKKLKEKMK